MYTQRSPNAGFIVVFKQGVTSAQISEYAAKVQQSGGEIKDRYDQGAGILNVRCLFLLPLS